MSEDTVTHLDHAKRAHLIMQAKHAQKTIDALNDQAKTVREWRAEDVARCADEAEAIFKRFGVAIELADSDDLAQAAATLMAGAEIARAVQSSAAWIAEAIDELKKE